MLRFFFANEKLTSRQWFKRGFGRWVAAEEARLCRRLLPNISGLYALQLGGNKRIIAQSPARHRAVLFKNSSELRADWRELPIEAESLDLLVLMHALEASEHPHQVLREAERVLRPEGELVIVGFNRWSLLSFSRNAPWRKNWLSVAKVNDWLTLLGLKPAGGEYAVFLPPCRPALLKRRGMRRLEAAGRRWWPLAGGVYILHAIKRRPGIRLIPAASIRRQSADGLKKPSLAACAKR